MKMLLVLVFTVLMLSAAHAQREGGAYFGPFSRGDSSGANTFPSFGPPPPQQRVIVRKKKLLRAQRARDAINER
jgi:hypothetical protein